MQEGYDTLREDMAPASLADLALDGVLASQRYYLRVIGRRSPFLRSSLGNDCQARQRA